jgi:hypothetical protein
MLNSIVLFIFMQMIAQFCSVDPSVDPIEIHNPIQSDLDSLAAWSDLWKLEFKAEKLKEVIFHSIRGQVGNHSPQTLNAEVINRSSSHMHLVVILDANLSFNDEHLTKTITTCNNMLNPLRALKATVQSRHLEKIYMSFVLPHLEYGSILFDSSSQNLLGQLDKIHYRAAVRISGCILGSTQKVLKCLDWYMSQLMQKSTVPSAIRSWASVPIGIKQSISKNMFWYKLRTHIIEKKKN